MERTDSEKVTQRALVVTLGGEEYSVKPLCIDDALPWCEKFVKLVNKLPTYWNVKATEDASAFEAAANAAMAASPSIIVDLFFEYAKDIDRATVGKKATSAEIMTAFEGVLSLESPLLASLARMWTLVRQLPSSSS